MPSADVARHVTDYAADCGYAVSKDASKIKIERVTAERVFLLPDEFEHLFSLRFADPVLALHAARLLLTCSTGFRFSDLRRLGSGRVQVLAHERVFRIRQKKTRQVVTVPFNDYTSELVDRWGLQLFEGLDTLTNFVFQKAVKEVGRLAGFNTPVIVSRSYGGELRETEHRKWEVLSPHCGRHTFAVLSLLRGMKLEEVQYLLGHASISSTQVYSHIVESFTNSRLLEAWRADRRRWAGGENGGNSPVLP